MTPKHPDGPRINLVLAIMAQLLPKLLPFDPLVFNLRLAREFGDVAYYHVGPLKVYQLNHPDLARQILVEQPDKFHKPRFLKRAFRPFAGNGLLTSDGAVWKQQRKLIQPAFHHRALAAYAETMVSYVDRMMASWQPGQVREIGDDMMALTLGIVVKTLFGADLTSDAGRIGRLMTAVLEATNNRLIFAFQVPEWLPTPRNRREQAALAALNVMMTDLIRTRRASDRQEHDLLSMLLASVDEETGAQMSDQELRDEMTTLFMAGHETTATALTWTWYLLSQHPAVEDKLVEEITRALHGRPPTVADLASLPYTEMIIRESIRLYPPAPGVAREPIEDVMIGGWLVPKGSLVTVIAYALHRDSRFFDRPEEFDPERFAPGWAERIPRHAYLPFGGGPRVCIGNSFAMMEARLILAAVAQRYRLSLEPDQEVVPMQLVTVRPKHGLRMRVAARAPAG